METSITQLAEVIVAISGSKSGIKVNDRRSWDKSGRRFGSTVKSKSELNFVSEVDLKNGLLKTIEWTKENYDQILKKIDSHKKFFDET